MIIVLNDGQNDFEETSFVEVVNLIKKAAAFKRLPIELQDARGLQNNKNTKDFVGKIRQVDPNGYLPIMLRHTCDHFVDDDWVATVHNIASEYKNVFFPVEIRTDSNIDNVRTLLKEEELSRNMQFEFIIDREDFNLSRCINLVTEYTLNNHILLTLDHTKNLNYKSIADHLMTYNDKRRNKLIALDFNCGFPLCMFDDEQIGKLFKTPLMGLKFYCEPIVVVYPTFRAAYCSMTNSNTLDINKVNSLEDLTEQLKVLIEDEEGVLYEDCNTCWYHNRLCHGGCVTARSVK